MSSPDPIVIVGARRTPQGRFLGSLAACTALDLAVAAAKGALGEIPASAIDRCIVGNCLPPILNVSRQMSLALGIPQSADAFTVNMACASGLKAITLAADALRLGDAEVVLCGGTESMSNAPHFLPRSRTGYRLSDGTLVDSLLLGLKDPAIGKTMPETAQLLAERFCVSREEQDRFALASHQKALAAQKEGGFDAELIPLAGLEHDEHPRADTTLERLATLKPTLGAGTTITAGNASGINDGAAMVVLTTLSTAKRNGWQPLAQFSAYATTGCAPEVMGEGPVHAIRKLHARTGHTLADYDAIEINEAFAAQALACLKQLDLAPDDPRFNRCGSGIALGHPIGASGARLVVHLAHQLAHGNGRRALASLCVGGGMGIAATLEAL
ncbi:MAG TPA: thiolase family protein [Chthoniobacteraceae bacterium]|nr:thiolase family protein [Chthoniobacteraceae bacterium]